MKLTPLEVQQKTFRKSRFGGSDAEEVAHFLEAVARAMEDQTRELHRLQEAARQKDTQLAEFREREQMLQATMTTAQRVSDDLKALARKEAEVMLSDAELQAEKIIANAQSKRLQLISDIDELKRARATFIVQLTVLVDGHKMLLQAMAGTTTAEEKSKSAAGPDNVSFFAPPSKR